MTPGFSHGPRKINRSYFPKGINNTKLKENDNMKNIEIALVVRAESVNNAENIAMRELMELAKAVAKRKGASMSQGSGSASPLTSDAYQVNAAVALDCDANINDILAEVQNVWMGKPEIVHSAFAIAEEKREAQANPMDDMEQCECCGGYFYAGDMVVVNRDTEHQYWLCPGCFDFKAEEEEITCCGKCNEYVDMETLVENPVTHEKNICPLCGEIL
jgi:hypothetical protein